MRLEHTLGAFPKALWKVLRIFTSPNIFKSYMSPVCLIFPTKILSERFDDRCTTDTPSIWNFQWFGEIFHGNFLGISVKIPRWCVPTAAGVWQLRELWGGIKWCDLSKQFGDLSCDPVIIEIWHWNGWFWCIRWCTSTLNDRRFLDSASCFRIDTFSQAWAAESCIPAQRLPKKFGTFCISSRYCYIVMYKWFIVSYDVPGTLNNHFLMDVWWNNHSLCNDLESSNWNNHKKLVVWSSRYFLNIFVACSFNYSPFERQRNLLFASLQTCSNEFQAAEGLLNVPCSVFK